MRLGFRREWGQGTTRGIWDHWGAPKWTWFLEDDFILSITFFFNLTTQLITFF